MIDGIPDPFVSPETLGMMKGLYELYSAAVSAGFPETVAVQLVTGIFCTFVQSALRSES